jgi:hypothetical protein
VFLTLPKQNYKLRKNDTNIYSRERDNERVSRYKPNNMVAEIGGGGGGCQG